MLDQVAVEEIVTEVSRSDETNCATIANIAQDDVIGSIQQVQVLDDVNTVVTNLSDPVNWPVTRNSKTIDHIIATGSVQIHIDNYPKNDMGRHFFKFPFHKKLANNETV
ncbi:unnamed protein product [Arctia plantaginis]|uniref:Uncharacterized protein n=1 Tax=Arctia plantaginis TaxID=874455 RepID=A0A8S0Z9Z3_ARCPL|nr:unnamed protein product [Arctia plantaginis]